MEVILNFKFDDLPISSILHVCGGDPCRDQCVKQTRLYSPRMWRWSQDCVWLVHAQSVFSTYVEVIPTQWLGNKLSICILHVCGGDPSSPANRISPIGYSPRMWRWSILPLLIHFLKVSILHVCGGDPCCFPFVDRQFAYSPRMWRWSFQHHLQIDYF